MIFLVFKSLRNLFGIKLDIKIWEETIMKKTLALVACLVMLFTMCVCNAAVAKGYKYEDKAAGTYNIFYLQGYLKEHYGLDTYIAAAAYGQGDVLYSLATDQKKPEDCRKYEVHVMNWNDFYDVKDAYYISVDIGTLSTEEAFIGLFEKYLELRIRGFLFAKDFDQYSAMGLDLIGFELDEQTHQFTVTYSYQDFTYSFAVNPLDEYLNMNFLDNGDKLYEQMKENGIM